MVPRWNLLLATPRVGLSQMVTISAGYSRWQLGSCEKRRVHRERWESASRIGLLSFVWRKPRARALLFTRVEACERSRRASRGGGGCSSRVVAGVHGEPVWLRHPR